MEHADREAILALKAVVTEIITCRERSARVTTARAIVTRNIVRDVPYSADRPSQALTQAERVGDNPQVPCPLALNECAN